MKLRNNNGFTLMELLIVVAIIGVLIAVGIPVFTAQLENSKIAVDQSNVRAGKAAVLTEWMLAGENEDAEYVLMRPEESQ